MIQRLISALSRSYGYLQVLLNPLLAHEIIKTARPETDIQRGIFSAGFPRYNALYDFTPAYY